MKYVKKLSDSDLKIWQRVARTIQPLSAPKLNLQHETHIRLPIAPTPILHHNQKDVQTRSDKKVRRGQVKIDYTIDLHDMARSAAFANLKSRLKRAHESGFRTVLIITGKGPNLQGVLRRSLRGWLNDPSIREMISNIAPSHIRHGGTGAFYVFLKQRK